MLRREWRAGQLRLLVFALIIAVAGVSAVGFFTDRIGRVLVQQSGELIAADLALDSRDEVRPEWREAATRLGLHQVQLTTFRSVVLAGDNLKLAEVKAVGEGYPLRGHLRVAARPFGEEQTTDTIPAPGEAWLDARLLTDLGLQVGDTLGLGEVSLRVGAVLTYEPDRGGSLFNIAPRLLFNRADLAATGLLGPGALKQEKLLLAGDEAPLAAFRAEVEPTLDGRTQLIGGRDARPELNQALQRGERFLGLAALVSLLLAGVAIALAAHRHAERHRDSSALMRCLGAKQGFIAGLYLRQLLILGLLASALGALIGLVAQEVLAQLLAGVVAQALPAPSLWPLLHALLTGLVTLFGFAAPPLLALRNVPPLRVLRRELVGSGLSRWWGYGAALLALLALMGWQARDPSLTLMMALGAIATLGLFALAGWVLLALIARLRGAGGVAWRFGLANLVRRRQVSLLQLVAFGLGLTALLLLGVVRGDLLSAWAESLPENAPNHFLINIQPDQRQPLSDFFTAEGYAAPPLLPMVRGRLAQINDHQVQVDDYASPRARRLSQRDFNLSQAAQMNADNKLLAGEWWTVVGAPPQWSVEEGLAQTLGITLGDELTLLIEGRPLTAKVTSLRSVDWASFHPNFFILAPPGTLDTAQASYITSFYVTPTQKGILSRMVAAFPNITVIEIDALMNQVRAVIERVSLAVEFVFLFTLLAGVMVLLAAIQATHDERLREGAILRTLGAGRRVVLSGLIAEFSALGLLSGLLASLAAGGLGWLVAARLFEVDAPPSATLWLAGLGSGLLVVTGAGLWGTRRVLNAPPLGVLRGGR